MKNLKFWLVYLLLIFWGTACRKETAIQSDLELAGKWKLDYIIQENDTIKKPEPYHAPMEVSLTFKDKGELEATSSNNFLTGFYETAQDNTIQLGGGGTEREETDWGNLFLHALPDINLYDLKSNRLTLISSNNSRLVFSRAK
ncbi:hypothetical protein DYBT9275_00164 [Dyadobacter sp. CECT 9275]|uniref:DUF306 domain-containing protein n=1 Tax=Dyadobacter helix TaxID=2822344 RepID=A0A916JB24_9BACT|nr:META domain-containing protein [Dyadobacter sp. CECT 9275]CAG4988817.1 hypothetical protein DYBT9275_00164 [Dyadobacter sp. CECT 9275]